MFEKIEPIHDFLFMKNLMFQTDKVHIFRKDKGGLLITLRAIPHDDGDWYKILYRVGYEEYWGEEELEKAWGLDGWIYIDSRWLRL